MEGRRKGSQNQTLTLRSQLFSVGVLLLLAACELSRLRSLQQRPTRIFWS